MITGEVLEMDTRKPLSGVQINNIYTNIDFITTADGKFSIAGMSGQLLEFRIPGYKVTRVRIPHGYVPPFFRIILEHTPVPLIDDMLASGGNYKRDSIKSRNMYEHVLDFPRMSAIEKIKSPFSALSARNREIWQFQEVYEASEKEKYVDYTFNKELVTKITGFTDDSLTYFMNRFRPTYEQLRSMNEYTFQTYIKNSAYRVRHPNRPVFGQ
jgi:hypothetical protein